MSDSQAHPVKSEATEEAPKKIPGLFTLPQLDPTSPKLNPLAEQFSPLRKLSSSESYMQGLMDDLVADLDELSTEIKEMGEINSLLSTLLIKIAKEAGVAVADDKDHAAFEGIASEVCSTIHALRENQCGREQPDDKL